MSSASKVRSYTLFGIVGGAALGVLLVLPAQTEQPVFIDAPVKSAPASPAPSSLDSGVDWHHAVRDDLAAGASIANYDRW